jgi:sugar phosphate isomerase/epimerase
MPADRLGLDFISVLGMPPVQFVELAAQLGVKRVGMSLVPFTGNPHGYPAWSLRDDPGLRRDLLAALKDNDVAIGMGEWFLVRPGADIGTAAHDLDLMAELGIPAANALSIDPDVARCSSEFARFAAMTAERGMGVTVEYMAGTALGGLDLALAAVRAAQHPNLKLLVDCMHFARSGDRPEQIAAAAPGEIGYLQLCDVPNRPLDASYGEEALNNRLAPGDGDVPLGAILAALPRDVPVGLEVPMLAKAEAGLSPRDYLGDAVTKARALLAAVGD